MDNVVIGSNRSSMRKEEVSYGYDLVYRQQNIFDFVFLFMFMIVLAVAIVSFPLVDERYRIYIYLIPITAAIIYTISRINRYVLKLRVIESQFSSNEPIVMQVTFYQDLFDVETHILGKINMFAVNYSDIKRIIYDKRIVVIVRHEEKNLICFNPIFFKGISLDEMIEYMKYENESIKITKMYV